MSTVLSYMGFGILELLNRVTQNDVIFGVTNLKDFTEILILSY